MAKITIVIEDKPDNMVKVTCDPTFETMMQMTASGHSLTSAHGYALAALNHIRSESKRQSGRIIVPVPSIGRH